MIFRGDEEDSAIIMLSLQDKKNLNNKDNKDKAYNEITQNKVLFIIMIISKKSKMNENDSLAMEEKEASKKNPSDKENSKKIKRLPLESPINILNIDSLVIFACRNI